MKTKLLSFFVLLCFCSGFAQPSFPGEIDNSFNSSGIGAYAGNIPPAPLQPELDAVVYTSSVYGPLSPHKDKIIIGGRFTSYNGVETRRVARLNSDGTFDATFNPIVNFASGHYVYCSLALPDGSVIVGGSFTVSHAGTAYKNIMKFNADGDVDNTFMANGGTGTRGLNALVHALALDGNKIVIGGAFGFYQLGNGGNIGCKRVIRLLANGMPDPSFINDPNLTTTGGNFFGGQNEVRSLTVQADGKILVGGFFDRYIQYGTTYMKNFVRLNADGTYDTSFDVGGVGPSHQADVSLAVYDSEFLYNEVNPAQSKILAVGSFTRWYTSAGSFVTKRGIVRLNLDGSLDPTFNAAGAGTGRINGSGYKNVFCIQMQPDGKILIGGSFNGYNNTTIPKGIARLNADGTLDATFLSGAGFYAGTDVYGPAGSLRNITLQSDSKIIVSGDFEEYDNTERRMIARIKTRECFNATVYYDETGWDNGVLPTDATYYASLVDGTYTIPTGVHLHACELEIKPGATLIISAGASMTVEGVLMNNGKITIEDTGSLVQVKEDAVNADLGNGLFEMYRNTTPMRRFDFTYWSSPTESQTLYNFSPNTLADKYYKFNAVGNNWVTIMNGNETMAAGEGYIIRAPQSHSQTLPSIFTGMFTGRVNNGTIEKTIYTSPTNDWNLVGNPYPSAIDAIAFVDDADNISKINGTLYFWTHNTAVDYAGQLQYQGSDYAVFNKTGMVNTSPTSMPFDEKIAAGQGFFVESLVDNQKLKFKNSMRVKDNNNQFYRTAQPQERHRLWLNLTAQGKFNQTLIGYVSGATNDFDRSFDGKYFSNSTIKLFTTTADTKLAIQGRALPFADTDVIPLGYTAATPGSMTISLGQYDGIFAGDQAVYLVDHKTNTTHSLKDNPYTFMTPAGTFESRFKLIFKTEPLTYLSSSSRLSVAADVDIQIATIEQKIKNVEVTDVNGKVLFTSSQIVNENDLSISGIMKQNQLLLVKVALMDGTIETKKIVF